MSPWRDLFEIWLISLFNKASSRDFPQKFFSTKFDKGRGQNMNKIVKSPESYKECAIYQRFVSIANAELQSKVDILITELTPLLNKISNEAFKNYTLHDVNHSQKVIYLSGEIIDIKTLHSLTSLELAIIIMSAYLHDAGMYISYSEKESILKNKDFIKFIDNWPNLSKRIMAVKNKLEDNKDSSLVAKYNFQLYQLYEVALSEYIRTQHATLERYQAIIDTIKMSASRNDLFEFDKVSFEEILIEICISHNMSPEVLMDYAGGIDNERFPRELTICGEKVNAQFCASLLRISDVLDFDRERTPAILYDNLGVSYGFAHSEVSILEWNKHMAINTITIDESEIIISAMCHNPIIEKAIKDFSKVIEHEIIMTKKILTRNIARISEHYYLNIPDRVQPQIRSIGYVYRDMGFRLNQSAILEILIGEKLYNKNAICVRELIQNSIDACKARMLTSNEPFYPLIELTTETDADGDEWLVITDNGIGMDEHVLDNYFFTIGNSYYNSSSFYSSIKSVSNKKNMIARFGIGIISVFLIGTQIKVTTKNNYSIRNDAACRSLRVNSEGLAFIQESVGGVQGTSLAVKLKPYSKDINGFNRLWIEIKNILDLYLIRPAYSIKVKLPNYNKTINNNEFYMLKKEVISDLIKRNIFPVSININDNILRGKIIIFCRRKPNGSISLNFAKRELQEKELPLLLSEYEGNRITVNGFRMFKANRAFRIFGTAKLLSVFDIDINDSSKIEYDISRDKLTYRSLSFVRDHLRKVLDFSLESDSFESYGISGAELLVALHGAESDNAPFVDPELLEKVLCRLPARPWPKMIHKTIAEELNISNTEVSKIIAYILNNNLSFENPSRRNP